MKRSGNSLPSVFSILFPAIVILLGIAGFMNLARSYIHEEAVNNEWKEELGSKFETDIAGTFPGKTHFVDLNGAVHRILGQREMNGVVKLDNGYLLTPMEYCSDESLHHYAEKTAAFDSFLKERGSFLVYASTPYTSSKYDPGLPTGISDYGNSNIDRFLDMLKEAGVDTIDFRETMHQDGIDHYSMMYKTDHHWTTEAGFYAYGIIENYLKEKTGCEVDERISGLRNYTVRTYEKWHLGSRGQRTGKYYAGMDDFTLILPDFPTLIENREGKTGTMPELMMDLTPLANRNRASRYTYDIVLGNGAYLGHYFNRESKNDIRLLVITDSFGKAVIPYLVMGFKEVYSIYDEYSATVTEKIIEEYDPDAVIMLVYPEELKNDSRSFSFDIN